MSQLSFSTPIAALPMIGPVYTKRLAKLGIETLKDLLYHFPHRHADLSLIMSIESLQTDTVATIKGSVISAKNIFTRRGKQIQKATVSDGTGQIEATWFNQNFLVEALNKSAQVYFSGKVNLFQGKLTMISPEFEPVRSNFPPIHTAGLIPIYPETYGVSSKWLRSRIAPLIRALPILSFTDHLPPMVKQTEQLMDLSDALVSIHFPQTQAQLQQARTRLAFDELYLLQLASNIRKYQWSHKHNSHHLKANLHDLADSITKLPFTLTSAQTHALEDILKDFSQTTPMNRLLQGDVGSGKTIVAALAMLLIHQHGLKSILMAPTEILAAQQFAVLNQFFSPFHLQVQLVTSATKKNPQFNIDTLNADILVGTHALLHRELPTNVGLVVVDEQHRFGVEQRAKLIQFEKTPHLLSLTATPIPRTIALSLYGELDVSVIDELPVGRLPVKTWVVGDDKREKAYAWIRNEIAAHSTQAFIVCPLIEDSLDEKLAQVKAVKAEFDHLQTYVFPQLKLSLLHGRLKSTEKQTILEAFRQHQSHILVSTPVIEVGIDIKNASIMVIEGAERFGLAQLHQLRGRVGRGDQASYCLLFTSTSLQQNLERLKAMEKYHSGFKLSEIDLKLRGPGEVYGLKQSGFASLKIATFSDHHLVSRTHYHASILIAKNPTLSDYPLLQSMVNELLAVQTIEPN